MESLRNCAVCCITAVIPKETVPPIGKLEAHLNVIFILKNIFEVKPDELGSFLGKWGDPDEWVNLCENCDKDVASFRRIFERLCEVKREFQRMKCELQERIRMSEENILVVHHDVVHESWNLYRNRKVSLITPTSSNPFEDGDIQATEMALHLNDHVKKEEVNIDCDNDNPVEVAKDIFSPWNADTHCDNGSSGVATPESAEVVGADEDYDPNPHGISGKGSHDSDGNGNYSNSELSEDYSYSRKRCRYSLRKKRRKSRKTYERETNVTKTESLKLPQHQFHPCPEEECSKTFQSNKSLLAHMYKYHKNLEPKKYYHNSQPKAPPMPRPNSNKGNPSSSLLPTFEVDMSKFTYTPDNPVGFCNICGKHMDKFKRFKDHMRAAHHKKEVCTICGETMRSLHAVRQHLEKVHNVGDYKCEEPECNQVFLTEPRLLKHKDLDHLSSLERNQCEICKRKFVTRQKLKVHVEMIHERKFERICPICSLRVSSVPSYKVHMQSVHDVDMKDCEVPPPLCQLSPEERKKLEDLNAKTNPVKFRKKKKKSMCHHCGKELDTEFGLKRHMFFVHEFKGVRVRCDVEGCTSKKVFLNEGFLRRHKRFCHSGVPKVEPKCVCQYCGKQFRNRHRARTHELRIHSNDSRTFMCPVKECNRGFGFTTQRFLDEHLKAAHNIISKCRQENEQVKNPEVETNLN